MHYWKIYIHNNRCSWWKSSSYTICLAYLSKLSNIFQSNITQKPH